MQTQNDFKFDGPQLLLKSPIYHEVKAPAALAPSAYIQFLRQNLTLDVYCPQCKGPTVIKGGEVSAIPSSRYDLVWHHTFVKLLHCSRNDSHHFEFVFRYDRPKLTKIGQWPSL